MKRLFLTMPIEFQLTHAATAYDRAQSTKRGYNIYALPMYLDACHRIAALIAAGTPARAAVLEHATGRLATALLKQLGEPALTRDEARGF